jgi:putative acetyltransferase
MYKSNRFRKGAGMEILIHPERPSDTSTIDQVTIAAFSSKPYASHTEHLIVDGLRNADALSLSLVAEVKGQVVGHVAFSIVTINGEKKGWYGLGPISVLPEFQKQGIGAQLIRKGLSMIRDLGGQGCVLEGSPVYYQRFGFKAYPNLIYEGAPSPEYFMALPFHGEVPEGKVQFHQAFYIDAEKPPS